MTSPPLRPIRVIGRVVGRDVEMGPRFLRWLEDLFRQNDENTDNAAPTGSITATMASTAPANGKWLLCNGQSVSKTTYASLFAVIGNTYGETATEFTLPDLSNRFLVGADTIALKATGGASTVTLVEANLPAHSHAITDTGHTHGITDPGHTHTAAAVDSGTATAGAAADGATAGNTGSVTTGVTVNSATTGITLGNTGSGTAFDITPPAVGVNWLIKT